MNALVIWNDPPYGTERSWNGLRLAGAPARRDGVQMRVFLLGDAVGCAVAGQKMPGGSCSLEHMISYAARHGAAAGCCGTCLDDRGITDERLVAGACGSSLEELADWTLWADQVLTFRAGGQEDMAEHTSPARQDRGAWQPPRVLPCGARHDRAAPGAPDWQARVRPRARLRCGQKNRHPVAPAFRAGAGTAAVAQVIPGAAATTSAAAYDRWFDSTWGRYAFTVEEAAIERAAGQLDGLRVLDAGCGTGRFTACLERRAARLVGVDLDPAMLAVAAQRVRTPLLTADASRLPFRDAAFDVAIAVTVCEFTASPAAAVAELARVTRPGGRIVIGALNRRSPWGLARRRRLQRRPPWQQARFLTRGQLRAFGARHGRVRLHGALIAPGAIPGTWPGSLLEAAGRRACPAIGAFQVLAIEKATP
jgi:uncharacterized protein involved in oxidation of intracellular sulfur